MPRNYNLPGFRRDGGRPRGFASDAGPVAKIFGTAVTIILLIVVFRIVIGLLGSLWTWLEATLHQKWASLLGCAVLLAVGWILFLVRLRWRFQYGLMEITFALASGWKWFSAAEENGTTDLLAGLAVVYLIVRGLDNCYQAMQAQAVDKQLETRRPEVKETEEATQV